MEEDEFVIDAEAAANRKAQAADGDLADEELAEDTKVKKLKKEIETLRAEKQENMDGWQRSKADYVNALRRFEDEKKGAKDAGIEKAVEALLPAFDAIERAKAHGEVPPGFEAIVRQLESAFAALGLEPVGAIGDAFDPMLHEALGQDAVETDALDDTVTTVLETGWKRGERVIRPAKVKVGRVGSGT